MQLAALLLESFISRIVFISHAAQSWYYGMRVRFFFFLSRDCTVCKSSRFFFWHMADHFLFLFSFLLKRFLNKRVYDFACRTSRMVVFRKLEGSRSISSLSCLPVDQPCKFYTYKL
uniref:Uncharacterized protein n=1 Tax=Ixodes ricinus TaxID=34613 RepID=A0A6B0UM47_IXORI